MAPCDLHGLAVLVVEDMLLVADVIAAELEDAGCRVVGPAGRLPQGLALAASESLDGAFIDINLAGEFSFPIADVLAERGIPFVFLTGYGDHPVTSRHSGIPHITKPFAQNALLEAAAGFRNAVPK